MYADYDGKVNVDCNDFRQIDKDSWYQCLSVVTLLYIKNILEQKLIG